MSIDECSLGYKWPFIYPNFSQCFFDRLRLLGHPYAVAVFWMWFTSNISTILNRNSFKTVVRFIRSRQHRHFVTQNSFGPIKSERNFSQFYKWSRTEWPNRINIHFNLQFTVSSRRVLRREYSIGPSTWQSIGIMDDE